MPGERSTTTLPGHGQVLQGRMARWVLWMNWLQRMQVTKKEESETTVKKRKTQIRSPSIALPHIRGLSEKLTPIFKQCRVGIMPQVLQLYKGQFLCTTRTRAKMNRNVGWLNPISDRQCQESTTSMVHRKDAQKAGCMGQRPCKCEVKNNSIGRAHHQQKAEGNRQRDKDTGVRNQHLVKEDQEGNGIRFHDPKIRNTGTGTLTMTSQSYTYVINYLLL